MQLSAVPVPVTYVPVQPVAPIARVKTQDSDGGDAASKVRPAPPPGVGSLLDIQA